MNRTRKTPPPPAWFKIEKYAAAANLGFRDWTTQIGNRIDLQLLLTIGTIEENSGMLEDFDRKFNRIISDPFIDLGFSFPSLRPDKAVYPLTFGAAKRMVEALSDANFDERDFCDNKLRKLSSLYNYEAHLGVNLQAPKSLLIKQFREFVEEFRIKDRKRDPPITEPVTQRWAVSHPILPYQDLNLWHKRHALKMPSNAIMADWLNLKYGNRDTVQEIKEKVEWVFSLDCYGELRFSAANQ
ncbi:MAG TPA: DUF6387 family protein [Gallionellaceae bacterium]|nr:DUF6387 family protein [Gallionellaceae bacterium]